MEEEFDFTDIITPEDEFDFSDIISESPNKPMSWWDSIKNAFERGMATADIAEELNPHKQQADYELKYDTTGAVPTPYFAPLSEDKLTEAYQANVENIDLNKIQQAATTQEANPASPGYQRFTQAQSFGEGLSEFVKSPFQILSELTIESLTPLVTHGASRIAAGAITGAALGPGGAATGALAGLGSTSLNLEYASDIMDSLRQAGVDFSSIDSMKSSLADPDVMGDAKRHALAKSIPIAVFDAVSAGVAGTLFKTPTKSLLKRAGRYGAELVTQSGFGAGGEIAGELAAGDELQPGAILAEALGELGGAPVEIAAGLGKATTRSVRSRAAATTEQVDKAIAETSTGDPQIDTQIDATAQISPELTELLLDDKATEQLDENQVEVDKQIQSIEKDAQQIQGAKVVGENSEDTQRTPQKSARDKEEQLAAEELALFEEKKKIAAERIAAALSKIETAETEADHRAAARELFLSKHAAAQIEGRGKVKRSAIKARIEKTTGVKTEKPTTELSLRALIEDRYRNIAKGVRKGLGVMTDELIPKVQEALKRTKMTQTQQSTILTKLKHTNPFSPGSYNRLNDFINRVENEADYANNLAEAKNINRSIRKALKDNTIPLNLRGLAKSFTAIPADETFIQPHLEMGRRIAQGLQNPKKGRTAFNAASVGEYIDKVNADLAQYEVASERTSEAPMDPEEKLQPYRQAAKFGVGQLKSKDLSEFDDSDVRVIKSIADIDLNRLSEGQLKQFIRVVDNLNENSDFSGADFIDSMAAAQRGLDEFEGIVNGTKSLGWLTKGGANAYQVLGRIFGGQRIQAAFLRVTGANEVIAAGSRTERRENAFIDKLDKRIAEIKRRYKVDVDSIENQIKLVAFGELYRHYGDNSHIEKVKNNMRRTAALYEVAERSTEAAAWQKAITEFADVTTIGEARAKMEPALFELWSFFNQTFKNEVEPGLARSTEGVTNKEFIPAENYSHSSSVPINTVAKEAEAAQTSAYTAGAPDTTNPTQAGTSIKATRNLRDGYAYPTSFNDAQLRGFRESVYKTEANKALAQLYSAMQDPKFGKLLGGVENTKFVSRMFLTITKIQAGISQDGANEAVKVIYSITQTLRGLGTVRALGSIAQLGKQTVSIGIKAAVNHLGTGSLGSFVSGITQYREASQLFDHYSIGARENRLGGVDRGTSKHFTLEGAEKSFYKGLDHVRKFSDKVGRKSLWFLTKADTYAAKTTWLGYYLQSLQEQGVSKADVSQEHTLQHDPRRQQAAAYAETMVGETQVPSNPATLAQISRNDAGAGWNIAKNIMLPFSTYNINAKYRYIQNMSRMLSNFNKETSAAVAGDLAEVASYIAMTSGVVALLWKPMLKGIIEKITGSEPPDRDEERIERNRDKGIISLAINQISPTSIGPGELVTAIAANRLTYIYNQVKNGEEKTYGEWKRETGGLVYDQDEFDYGLISLGFEPYSEAISNGVDQVNIWQGKPITYEPFAGVESKAESNDQIQAVLALKALMDAGQMIGLTEADLYREVVKVYKEQLRESTKNSKKPKPRRGRVRF